MALQYRTVPPTGRADREAEEIQDPRSRQIDELERLSKDHRNDKLGSSWDEEVQRFYDIKDSEGRAPSFRPPIRTPLLQTLLLSEATDLTDTNIRIYIVHKKSARDVEREKAFQEHWRQERFNNRLLTAVVSALFSGTSFVQVGYDKYARRGLGNVWLRARDPRTVFPDPKGIYPDEWSYVIIHDKMYLDEIRMRWGKVADLIRMPTTRSKVTTGESQAAGRLEMPAGPMAVTIRGLPGGMEDYDAATGALTVRHLFARDMTTRELTDEEKLAFTVKDIPAPEQVFKYPNGRYMPECNGIILADGDNPTPLGMFPVIPIWAMPPQGSIWCPPPMRYTRTLQESAERLIRGAFENAAKTNNGVWFLPEESGLTADNFGGLPGEIVVIAANSPKTPELKVPPQWPSQMTDYPIKLLQMVREIQGFTSARGGQMGAGNVAPELFEASVSQSQSITRLRARMLSESVQLIAEMVFYYMAKFYDEERKFPKKFSSKGSMEQVKWNPVDPEDEFDVYLDEGSIRPISQSAMRQLVLAMKKEGLIDTKHALEYLDFPNAEEIAEELAKEMQLAALAKIGRR